MHAVLVYWLLKTCPGYANAICALLCFAKALGLCITDLYNEVAGKRQWQQNEGNYQHTDIAIYPFLSLHRTVH